MKRRAFVLSAATLLALPAAFSRAADDPEVKTGLRVVATVQYLPGIPTAKVPDPVPLKRAAVRVFAEGGDKAVADGKTDDKGAFLVALPAGKYRVEVAPPGGVVGEGAVKVEVKEGEVSPAKVQFTVALKSVYYQHLGGPQRGRLKAP